MALKLSVLSGSKTWTAGGYERLCGGVKLMRITVDEHNLRTVLPDSRPKVRAAIAAYVRRVATDYANEVLSITLYGSQARGEADAESDIDLLIVVRHDTPTLRQALVDLAWQVQFEYDIVISDIIRSVEQLGRMQARRFPYYQSIEREGVLLWKSTYEPMPSYA
jgi:predicted nucleotidyltransferase